MSQTPDYINSRHGQRSATKFIIIPFELYYYTVNDLALVFFCNTPVVKFGTWVSLSEPKWMDAE